MGSMLTLLWHELVLLAVFGALGSWPAVLVRERHPLGTRLAVAPAFGFAIAASSLVTAAYVMPMKIAAWAILLPLVLGSPVLAVIHCRRQRDTTPEKRLLSLPSPGTAARLLTVIIVVATVANLPLAMSGSTGPLGYMSEDTFGFESSVIGLRDNTIRHADWGEPGDLTATLASGVVTYNMQIGADVSESAVTEMLFIDPTESHTAMFVMLMMIAALGVFAVVQGIVGRETWGAVAGAVLLAGPLFLQLLLDGAFAALGGVAILPALLLLLLSVRQQVSWLSICLIGVLGAGLHTVYPVFFPIYAFSILLALCMLGVAAAWQSQFVLRREALLAGKLLVAGLLAMAMSPVAILRNLEYWSKLESGISSTVDVFPVFHFPLINIARWGFQTRETYAYIERFALSAIDGTSDLQRSVGDYAWILLLALASFGVWRYRQSWLVLFLPLAAGGLSYYSFKKIGCSYCVQRGMITLGVATAILVGVGLAAVVEVLRSTKFGKIGGPALSAVVVLVVLAPVAAQSRTVIMRAEQGSFMFSGDTRSVVNKINDKHGSIFLEGFGSTYTALMEQLAVYNAVNVKTKGHPSFSPESSDFGSMAYVGGVREAGPYYDPAYRYVLTRAGGVETGRITVARSGPIALQKRATVDVAFTSGVLVADERLDSFGVPLIRGPVTYWVSSPTDQPVALTTKLSGVPPIDTSGIEGIKVVQNENGILVTCADVPGPAGLRRFVQNYGVPVASDMPPARPFETRPVPPAGTQPRLVAMSARPGKCPAPKTS